jgi:hypothetical protein
VKPIRCAGREDAKSPTDQPPNAATGGGSHYQTPPEPPKRFNPVSWKDISAGCNRLLSKSQVKHRSIQHNGFVLF